jgi:hypothetical protein
MKKIIILSAAVLGFNMAANAQATSTANQNVALSLSNAIAITFVSSGTATGTAVTIPFTTVADYTNGVTSSAQQLKVQSNKAFNVTVNANAANFTYSGTTTPSPTMPVSGVLAAQVTANGTGGTVATGFNSAYANLTSTAQSMISTCANGGNQTFSVQYMATPGFAYPAGTYTTNVVYTVTQP